MQEWLKIARRRDVIARALKVGVIVGTLLTAVNQGDLILAGGLTTAVAWKMSLTYLVPFCVSTYVGASTIIVNRQEQMETRGDL